MDLVRLFYDCDEFCREFLPRLQPFQIAKREKHRIRHPPLSVSEVMTILILFQTSGFRTLKTFPLIYLPASQPVLSPARELFTLCGG